MVIKKIGDLIFVQQELGQMHLEPGTIVERDLKAGHLDSEPKFILLQYGGTYKFVDIRKWKMELPTLKNGEVVNDLGKYMTELLGNFKKTFRISQS
jgi:hypothetical protein